MFSQWTESETAAKARLAKRGLNPPTEESKRAAVIASAPAGTEVQLSSGKVVDLNNTLAKLDQAYNQARTTEERLDISSRRLAIMKVKLTATLKEMKAEKQNETINLLVNIGTVWAGWLAIVSFFVIILIGLGVIR